VYASTAQLRTLNGGAAALRRTAELLRTVKERQNILSTLGNSLSAEDVQRIVRGTWPIYQDSIFARLKHEELLTVRGLNLAFTPGIEEAVNSLAEFLQLNLPTGVTGHDDWRILSAI
jgi:hypothetical protein